MSRAEVGIGGAGLATGWRGDLHPAGLPPNQMFSGYARGTRRTLIRSKSTILSKMLRESTVIPRPRKPGDLGKPPDCGVFPEPLQQFAA
jgi:hypothetical protein